MNKQIVSFSLTEHDLNRLKYLKHKYGMSQNDIISNLLDTVQEDLSKESLDALVKLNTCQPILDQWGDVVFPNLTHEDYIFSCVHLTPENANKIKLLRVKYKTSVSALIRILIHTVDYEYR